MKLPRQPQIVSIAVTCPHEGDATDTKALLHNFLSKNFDHVQSWWKDDDKTWQIRCYPKAVND